MGPRSRWTAVRVRRATTRVLVAATLPARARSSAAIGREATGASFALSRRGVAAKVVGAHDPARRVAGHRLAPSLLRVGTIDRRPAHVARCTARVGARGHTPPVGTDLAAHAVAELAVLARCDTSRREIGSEAILCVAAITRLQTLARAKTGGLRGRYALVILLHARRCWRRCAACGHRDGNEGRPVMHPSNFSHRATISCRCRASA